jgi:WD40 repeat protein
VYKSATRELAFPPRAHKGRVNSIAFSPDGSLLASASADQTARVWRMSDGREQFAVAHTINVLDVAFTSDRMSVFTAAADGMVRRFPLQADDLIAQAGRQVTRLPSAEECSEFHLEQQPICAAASAP